MAKVTLADYKDLMADRPRKFTAEEVEYRKAGKNEPICAGCMHYFVGLVMGNNVCEVMRPEDEHVEPEWTCDFHTTDGTSFPLYDGE